MHWTLDFSRRYVSQGEFREQLKGCYKGQGVARFVALRLDTWVTGNLKLLRGNGFAVSAANEFVQGFFTCLQAMVLLNHLGRHFARTETGDLQGFAHARQAGIGCGFNFFSGNGQFDCALQRRHFLHGFGGAH